MKKQMRFLATVSLLLTTLFLSGCHGSKGLKEFKIPEQFDQSKNYEITFWAKNDTNKSQTAIYQQAIDSFETQFPNIKVNLRLYTDYGKSIMMLLQILLQIQLQMYVLPIQIILLPIQQERIWLYRWNIL